MDYELYHHGILGMKLGIRRYQPYPKGQKPNGAKEIGKASKKAVKYANKITHASNKAEIKKSYYRGLQDKAREENKQLAKEKASYLNKKEVEEIRVKQREAKSLEAESAINSTVALQNNNDKQMNALWNLIQDSGSNAVEKRKKAIAHYEKYKDKKLKSVSDSDIDKGRDYLNEILKGQTQYKTAKTDEAKVVERKLEKKAKRVSNKLARIEKKDRKTKKPLYEQLDSLREENKRLNKQHEEAVKYKVGADALTSKAKADLLKTEAAIGVNKRATKSNLAKIENYDSSIREADNEYVKKAEKLMAKYDKLQNKILGEKAEKNYLQEELKRRKEERGG